MLHNRSMPASAVVPILSYSDVRDASRWLCDAFGFELRLLIGNHRAQLAFGDGSVVVTELKRRGSTAGQTRWPFAVMVRVEDVDAHHHRALRLGAKVTSPPASYAYGERQYSCRDPAGYDWTFSQSIADIAPQDWGGVAVCS